MPRLSAGQLLFNAARYGDAAGVEAALNKRAPPDYRDNIEGMTPLHMACCSGHEKVVQLLLSRQASTSVATDGGSTPLALACVNQHTHIVQLLLDAGASPDQPKAAGPSPLALACASGDERTVKALLGAGATAGLTPADGATAPPLLASCMQGRPEIARLLLASGAGIDGARNPDGTLLFLPSVSAALMNASPG